MKEKADGDCILRRCEAIDRSPKLHFVGSPDATEGLVDLMQRYPDRFLFGADAAAPADQSKYLKVFYQYEPLWKSLDAETSRKVRLLNYERIFDEARRKVRLWESTHVPSASSN